MQFERGVSVGYRRIQVDPLTRVVGAEISGVRLAECDDETFEEILLAWDVHLALFFRDQPMHISEVVEFAARLGRLQLHPPDRTFDGYPEAMLVDPREPGRDWRGWYSDASCDRYPPAATLLYLPRVTPARGESRFASAFEAWDSLSPALRSLLSERSALHESTHLDHERRRGSRTGALHPIARTHPKSRRKALYVNRAQTTHIDGLYPHEAHAVLELLFDHIERPEFQCGFRWTPNTLALGTTAASSIVCCPACIRSRAPACRSRSPANAPSERRRGIHSIAPAITSSLISSSERPRTSPST